MSAVPVLNLPPLETVTLLPEEEGFLLPPPPPPPPELSVLFLSIPFIAPTVPVTAPIGAPLSAACVCVF